MVDIYNGNKYIITYTIWSIELNFGFSIVRRKLNNRNWLSIIIEFMKILQCLHVECHIYFSILISYCTSHEVGNSNCVK